MPSTPDAPEPLNAAAVGAALRGVGGLRVRLAEPAARWTTWRIGGPAAVMVEPDSVEALGRVIAWTAERSLRRLVIGGGSNLLAPDEGVDAVVIRIGPAMSGARWAGPELLAEAGLSLWRLAHRAMGRGWADFEHIVGIPGSLGGLIAMNGGSLRRTIGENLVSVTAFAPDGRRLELPGRLCELGHRRSRFQHSGEIVASVRLRPTRADEPAAIRRRMLAIIRERRSKFPLRAPSCGSVFYCPSEIYNRLGPPGWIIEQCGLKGARIGGARISPRHANFIVNCGGATAKQVLTLMRRIRRAVGERFGVVLPHEVRLIDRWGRSCRLTESGLTPIEPGGA